MKRYTAGQLIRFLSPVVALTTLLLLARPVGFWLALGTFILGTILLVPAFALALFLRAISRSPERYVLLPEQAPDLPRSRRPAVGWIPGDIR